ncbi:MAG: hypothetical protein ACXU86_18730, partial [Archangium sp.]
HDMKRSAWLGLAAVVAGLAPGCGGNDTTPQGKVQVFVEPEDTIPNGLDPGTTMDNVKDGWTVRYDKFLAVVGNLRASQSGKPGATLADPKNYIIDLKNVPGGGLVLAQFDAVEAVRWDKFGFDMPNAKAGFEKAPGISQADYDFMVQHGYSVYVEGRATKADGQSCKPTAPSDCVARTEVRFRWGIAAGTSFDDCGDEQGEAGFAVPSGGSVQVKPTIHGDHWFFTNITQGAEITERKAQWIADADLDRDGETTLEELKNVHASDVFTPAKGYNLSGAIIPVNTAYDYVEAQMRTIGDYQGEGECPTRKILP